MKILCVSDQIDPFVYTPNIKDQFGDVSAVLCAGDLPMNYIDFIVSTLNKPTFFIFGNHNLKEYKYYHPQSHISALDTMTSITDETKHAHGAFYLGFKCIKVPSLQVEDPITKKARPLLIAGVSGSMDYNHGPCQFTEMQMATHLFAMKPNLMYNKLRYGTFLDIFLTHASPRHIHDKEDPCHRGFNCFNKFLKKYNPTYMVHGHIHLYDQNEERSGVYGKTTIINAYSHCVIELPSPK